MSTSQLRPPDSLLHMSPVERLQQLRQERERLLAKIRRLARRNLELRREAGAALFPRRLRTALEDLLGDDALATEDDETRR